MTIIHRTLGVLLAAAAATLTVPAGSAQAAPDLLRPHTLIVDRSLSTSQVDALTLAPLRYDTFWGNGDPELARAALDPAFVDRTLPAGRAQGVTGPLEASAKMRTAIPDLTCEVDQMIVTGDRVVTHLHFRGNYTGVFDGVQGSGQDVDFIATDIYRVANGQIVENWHIEDNQTLMQHLGA